MDMRVAGRVREAAEAVGNGAEDWAELVNAWRELTGANVATLLAWDTLSGDLWGRTSVGFDAPDALAAYATHFQYQDPLVPVGWERGAGSWLDSAEDVSTQAWRGGEFYADMLRPQRIEQSIALALRADDRYLVSLSMHFDREWDASGLKTRASPLRGLLIDAVHRRAAQREQECFHADSLLSSDRETWLLLDTALRVRHACPAVGQLLSGAAALHVVDGRLCARHASLASRLAIAVAKARADGVPQTVHCAAGWGRVLQLALAPAPAQLLMFNEPLLLMRVQLLDAARLPDVDALCAVYGLTASEARLVRELVAGHSLDDCAFLFAVSRNTLRNQLASVFRKMDCARQSEVVRLAALLS